MAYKNTNKLKQIKLVQCIVQTHYEDGITSYKGIYEKYVNPIYPMSYRTFLNYISTPVRKEDIQNDNQKTD